MCLRIKFILFKILYISCLFEKLVFPLSALLHSTRSSSHQNYMRTLDQVGKSANWTVIGYYHGTTVIASCLIFHGCYLSVPMCPLHITYRTGTAQNQCKLLCCAISSLWRYFISVALFHLCRAISSLWRHFILCIHLVQ